MKRSLSVSLAALLIASSVTVAHGGDGKAPRGYTFFAPRNRAAAKAAARAVQPRGGERPAQAVYSNTASKPSEVASTPTVPPMPMPMEAPVGGPSVSQVTWGTIYGEGYSYPGTGPSGSYGTPFVTPLHGYRATYHWAGHNYSMHCYCAPGYEGHCSGYRGECYRPGWNDAAPCGFERRCGRGSPLDCFWHRGGYEHPPRCTDCPYVCGTPSWSSYGFPPETYGAPSRGKGRSSEPSNYYSGMKAGSSDVPTPPAKTLSVPLIPNPAGPTLPTTPSDPGDAPLAPTPMP